MLKVRGSGKFFGQFYCPFPAPFALQMFRCTGPTFMQDFKIDTKRSYTRVVTDAKLQEAKIFKMKKNLLRFSYSLYYQSSTLIGYLPVKQALQYPASSRRFSLNPCFTASSSPVSLKYANESAPKL
jgi:hypothetical protein